MFFGIKMLCMDESCCTVHFLAVPDHCIIQVWIFSKPFNFRQELYSLLHRGMAAKSSILLQTALQRAESGWRRGRGMLGRGAGKVQAQNQLSRNRKGGRKKAATKHPQITHRESKLEHHWLDHWLTVWHIEPWLEWQVGGDQSPFNEYFNKLAHWALSFLLFCFVLLHYSFLFSDTPLLSITLYPLSRCPCSWCACHMLKVCFSCVLCVRRCRHHTEVYYACRL